MTTYTLPEPAEHWTAEYSAEQVQAAYAAGLKAAPEGYKLVPLCLTPEMRCELLNPHGLATTELYAMLLAAAPEVKCTP